MFDFCHHSNRNTKGDIMCCRADYHWSCATLWPVSSWRCPIWTECCPPREWSRPTSCGTNTKPQVRPQPEITSSLRPPPVLTLITSPFPLLLSPTSSCYPHPTSSCYLSPSAVVITHVLRLSPPSCYLPSPPAVVSPLLLLSHNSCCCLPPHPVVNAHLLLLSPTSSSTMLTVTNRNRLQPVLSDVF